MSVQIGKEVSQIEDEIIDSGAFSVVEADEIPKPPSKIMKDSQQDETWEYLESFSEAMWKHVDIYLYRAWPVINRDPFNIARFPTAELPRLTKEVLIKTFGSGDYKILATDVNKTVKGKGGKFFEAYFSYRVPDYPPVVVIEELDTNHKNNRNYVDKLRAEGKLNSDGSLKMNQPVVAGGNDPALMALVTQLVKQISEAKNQVAKDPTVDALSSMYMKTHEQSMQLLKDQVKSDDPDKLVKMLAALKEMMPKAESGNSMLEVVVKMQGDMARIQAEGAKSREELMMKMFETMNAKKEEGGIKEQIETFQMMKEVFGNGGEGANSTPKWWEVAIEQGAPIVGKAFDMMLAVMSIKNYEAGLKKTGNPVNANPTQQQQQVVQPVIESGKVVEMPKQEETQQQTQFGQLLKQYGGLILNAINTGTSGDDFASSLEGMFGVLTYNQIAALGKDGIIAEMKGVPEFWDKVAGTPGVVEKFVDEFIEYGVEGEGEEK